MTKGKRNKDISDRGRNNKDISVMGRKAKIVKRQQRGQILT